jgi:hypothetical protein
MASIPRLPTVKDEVLLYTGPPWLLVMYGVLNALDGRYCRNTITSSVTSPMCSNYRAVLLLNTNIVQLLVFVYIPRTSLRRRKQKTSRIQKLSPKHDACKKSRRIGTGFEPSFKNVLTQSSGTQPAQCLQFY